MAINGGESADAGNPDEGNLLDWLRTMAEQHVPEMFQGATVPVAWLGRTSTDDAQDPTLSLPRQLENSRNALPPGFVIVAKFYDIESGRNMVENRGSGKAHEQFDIPIPRDGSIADLLAEAKRADRRFVAVVCESIERIARVTYFSTKIEYELEQAGVALLAADEGIDIASIPSLNDGAAPFRKATPTLTRRVKQAIAEWYVLNMLELSWGGLKAHTGQGFNIGKPPYGYLAERLKHPVKAKANAGRTKHRLTPDPVRGPVVTQVFLWRAIDRLSYYEIASRLNREPDRYPAPDPIVGEGRRRIGAWTVGNVREVLDNPKHTGYMVWNRRKRAHPARGVRGRTNPPTAWIWSPQPTHEPLVTRDIFAAASTTARLREGSRSGNSPNTHPQTKRSYLLRSYVRCEICGRRAYGCAVKGYVYYRCSPNAKNHAHMPWFAEHPRSAYAAEDQLTGPLALFFGQRVLGPSRKIYLSAETAMAAVDPGLRMRKAGVTAKIEDLKSGQANLIIELQEFKPTGDPDVDKAWRNGIQARFAASVGEQRSMQVLLDELVREEQAASPVDIDVLDSIPEYNIDITRLPEDQQRRLYDAFHLDIRFNAVRNEATIRVTVTDDTAPAVATAVETIVSNHPQTQNTGTRAPALIPGQRVGDALSVPSGAPIEMPSL